MDTGWGGLGVFFALMKGCLHFLSNVFLMLNSFSRCCYRFINYHKNVALGK